MVEHEKECQSGPRSERPAAEAKRRRTAGTTPTPVTRMTPPPSDQHPDTTGGPDKAADAAIASDGSAAFSVPGWINFLANDELRVRCSKVGLNAKISAATRKLMEKVFLDITAL